MNKFSYFLLAVIFFSFGVAASAQVGTTVKGVVSDTNGDPMVGVSVIEKGTTNGTVTDNEGAYAITLKKNNSTLIYNSLSYITVEKSVGNSASVNVIMEDDALSLTEVVVTGYGQAVSKDKLTAAISKVSSDIISRGSHGNALQSLSGTVTGVRVTSYSGQPGTVPEIVIRGGAALDGSGTPLYIVDGVQKTDISDINSNDIQSIEILKDAAATALYGAKANAGVVMVTTKQGREGKTEIIFKANVGIGQLRQTYDFLEGEDYLYYLRMAANRAGNTAMLTAAGPFGTGNVYESNGNENMDGVYSTMFLTDENRYLLDQGFKTMTDPVTGKTIMFQEFAARDGSLRDLAVTQDYNVSASGGNEKGKYYVGLGYYNEEGFPVRSGYERISFLGNSSYMITPWLQSKTNINFSKSDLSSVNDFHSGKERNFFRYVLSSPPTMKEYNTDGSKNICTINWKNGNWSAQDFFYRRNTNYKTTLSQSLDFRLTKHLSVKLNATWYLNMREIEKSDKKFLDKPGKWNSDRGVTNDYARRLDQTYNAIVGYENTWNDHSLNVIAGFEFYDRHDYGTFAYAQGGDSDDFISIGYFDKTLDKNIKAIKLNSTHQRERSMSVFLNAMYDYKSRYLFSFSARYDGYSKLVNNKWGFFPGISAAWNIHKEKWMKGSENWLSSLKIRAGYGQNGNVNLKGLTGPYDLQGNYSKTPGNYDGGYGLYLKRLPYPDLQWEKTTSADVAVEAVFLNRINFSIGFYNKMTSNLLATVPYPSSSGVDSQYTNNGKVRNRGLEMQLGATIFKNKDWNISADINATYMRAKTISLPDNGIENNRQGGQQVYDPKTGQLIWVGGFQEGQEYGSIYEYKMIDVIRDEAELQKYGMYQDITAKKGTLYGPEIWKTLTPEEKSKGQQLQPGDAVFQDVNGDNKIDQYDKVYLGNTIPRWLGGINLNFSWKGLSLYAQFDFAGRYYAKDALKQWFLSLSQGTFNTLVEMKDSWTEDNLDAKYPVLMYADGGRGNYRMSSLFVENSSYFCGRDISLSYSFPKKWMKAVRMQDLTLSFTGQNLFYITKTSLYSPEYGVNEGGGYGVPRTYLFGLRLTF